MGKQNLGKKVMIELQMVGEKGIIPSEFEEKNYLTPWGIVTKQILKWEEQGKVTCIKRDVTPYISTYTLTKHIQ
ncbi:MAG: hypothetical protein V1788_01845 [Nanoarchaeota archaeon]|nr:hypothetical protein [Nanoarchaeota archaeon]